MDYTIATIQEALPHNGAPAQMAELVFASDRWFLERFFAPKQKTLEALARNLQEPNSDVGSGFVILAGNDILGICCCYPAEQMFVRQLASLKNLMPCLKKEDGRKSLQAFAGAMPKVPAESLYLAKIAVTSAARGKGVGKTLVRVLETHAVSLGLSSISLHVHKANDAIGFYEILGFSEFESGQDYTAMNKEIPT